MLALAAAAPGMRVSGACADVPTGVIHGDCLYPITDGLIPALKLHTQVLKFEMVHMRPGASLLTVWHMLRPCTDSIRCGQVSVVVTCLQTCTKCGFGASNDANVRTSCNYAVPETC